MAASLVALRAMESGPSEKLLTFIRSLNLSLLWLHPWMLIGFVVSVILSFLCWEYRPKLTEPVAPPEVLEDQGSGI